MQLPTDKGQEQESSFGFGYGSSSLGAVQGTKAALVIPFLKVSAGVGMESMQDFGAQAPPSQD